VRGNRRRPGPRTSSPAERRGRPNHRLWGVAWFVFVLLLLVGLLSLSYFLTAGIYRAANLHPAPLFTQIVNTLLGLVFTGLVVGVVTKIAATRGWTPELNVFAPIIEALEKIAQGDFSIRVNDDFRDNEIVGKLASSVNKMALELDQMESMRQEFISNVSHEIQSPLTSIRGFAQALENDDLSAEERHHYLGIIENESIRLSRLTEDLLKLAALQSDHPRFEPRLYRLDEQIRSLILACEPQWTAKAIEMNISLDDLEITADEDLLSQVWNNLIHNSIKFTPQGGRIGIGLQSHDDQLEFKIQDNGLGISLDELPHVFERFYKADKSRTRTVDGSGLGLSIARTIVELHGGTIAAESQPGQGATFSVSLPKSVKGKIEQIPST
jgi:two-component system, OmpR family, phosphate regulon sensor histidine kinase PhoR